MIFHLDVMTWVIIRSLKPISNILPKNRMCTLLLAAPHPPKVTNLAPRKIVIQE
uniref:Uncharacterized protein n=1 Tax=Picea sitchensis TaxID=3332 RepID=A9NWW2_PICSI|nr:unknown [Picea sitchensis]